MSDAGTKLDAEEEPKGLGAALLSRLDLIDKPGARVRKRQVIGSYTGQLADANHRKGACIG